MGKKAKEHRKKVAKRNEIIKQQQHRLKKAQEDFLKQLIEREKSAGKFDNNQVIPGINGPDIMLDGPQI